MPTGSSAKRERQYEHVKESERAGGRSQAQLYAEARKRNIRGRSNMTKAQLERALAR
jgi:hypothetical protein